VRIGEKVEAEKEEKRMSDEEEGRKEDESKSYAGDLKIKK
jgi:hypothetical protein